jgi:hypothetical protein
VRSKLPSSYLKDRMPASADVDAPIPRQSWLALIPRRSLWKALAMVLLLVLILFLQRRAGVVVRHMGQLAPVAGGQSPSAAAPAASGARLRLASPPSPGHATSPPTQPLPKPSSTNRDK